MALPFPTKTRTWSKTTPNNGDYIDDEIDQIYANLAYLAGIQISRDLYKGLIMANNAATPDTKIDVTAGSCADSTRTNVIAVAALTKDLGSVWAVGNGNGGLDTGSLANNTWYYPYAILRPDTSVSDLIWSTSSVSPSLPANYTIYRRLKGAIRTDGASKIRMFTMDQDYWMWWSNGAITGTTNTVPLDVNVTNPGTSAVTRTMTVPALGVIVKIRYHVSGTTGNNGVLFSSLSVKDFAPSITATPLTQASGGAVVTNQELAGEIDVEANTSGQVRSRVSFSDGSTTLAAATIAWLEPFS